jgi:hypothetical protein
LATIIGFVRSAVGIALLLGAILLGAMAGVLLLNEVATDHELTSLGRRDAAIFSVFAVVLLTVGLVLLRRARN